MSYRNNRTGKYSQKKQKKQSRHSVWGVVLADILVTGVILLFFAFFHHVLPAIISEAERQEVLMNTEAPTEAVAPVTEPTEAPTQAMEATIAATEAPTAPTEPTEPPKQLTEWQIKFADQFSDEVIWTENSYKSPNVSITIETITRGEGSEKQTYHVADVYIASMDNFITYTANGEIRYFGTQDVLKMNEASDALFSVSGDFITYQKGGFLMRNGEVYMETTNNVTICALFQDGTMEMYDAKGYSIEDIKERGAVQVWSFGPVLLDENGNVRDYYKMPSAVSQTNPRSAIGYYEPGHYCFVVVDGRQSGYSKGMSIPELAAVFEELGCTKAYNLDGGGSAVMTFNHQRYSKQSNGADRKLGDILLIREAPAEPAEESVG